MGLSSAALLKGAIGLGTVSLTATGSYFLFFKPDYKTTKWDREIIKQLEENKNISFSISLSGTTATTFQSNTSFPNFSSDSQTATIKAVVSATSSTNTTLSAINGGTDWTWECSIEFKKGSGVSGTELEEKDKLAKENSGFLNKLLNNDGKTEKIRLIKSCAEARTVNTNKQLENLGNLDDVKNITGQTNKFLKSSKIFNVVAGNNSKLKVQDTENEISFKDFFGFK